MDGKLLVLCDEDVTLDEYGNRLDIRDPHKNILSCLELDLPEYTVNTENRDILFVDWKTFMPENSEFLFLVESIGMKGTDPETESRVLFEGMKSKSLMEKTYLESMPKGPRIDFPQVAMNDFFNRFTDLLEKNRIVQVLPCYSKKQDEHTTLNNRKVIQAWNDRNKTFKNAKIPTITKGINAEVLNGLYYEQFDEVYRKANDQMMKIMSRPDFADSTEEQEVGDE